MDRAQTHTIRLRTAWSTSGPRRWERSFNASPGLLKGIAQGERVWLAWQGPEVLLSCNGQPVSWSTAPPLRAELTKLIHSRNLLVLETDEAALLETVRLEIEPAGT